MSPIPAHDLAHAAPPSYTPSAAVARGDPPYAPPRHVTDLADCHFYHTTDLPGLGTVPGEWDLRGGVDSYLGGVPLAGRRVLEVGTANGFLCFEMERRGAEVVAYDLSEREDWDLVPYGGTIPEDVHASRKAHMYKINNAWWLAHRLLGSRARVVYGTVYEIPRSIGPVHMVTFGSILLHLRDPFLALRQGAALATETIVVTDIFAPRLQRVFRAVPPLLHLGHRVLSHLLPADDAAFVPDPERGEPWETWWSLSPALVSRYLRVLGFPHVRITYHTQWFRGHKKRLYTVVGTRAAAPAAAVGA